MGEVPEQYGTSRAFFKNREGEGDWAGRLPLHDVI